MHFYISLFLVALGTLAYEIALTRLLSVVSWYHLGFLAISVAMLGMTVGAIIVFLLPSWFHEERLRTSMRLALYGFAASLPISVIIICEVTLPIVQSGSAVWNNLPSMAMIILATSIPFLLAGIFISAALTRYPLPIHKLYAVDLLGAATGCLFALLAMTLVDTPTAIIIAAILPLIGAALVRESPGRIASAAWVIAGIAVAVYLASMAPLLSPQVVKGRQVNTETLEMERWNSYSRIAIKKEQHALPALWGANRALLQQHGPVWQRPMDIDGDAGTTLYKFNQLQDIAHLQYDVTTVVHELRQNARVAIIGVGGAKDIQAAIWHGQPSITGIELNAIFVDLLEGPMSGYSGLANAPQVTLVVDEARSYLSATDDSYDILQMSLIDTWAATGAGAFSLSENGLYTVEAWQTFLDRLTPGGVFTVSRWFADGDLGETARMVSLAMATLMERGVADPAQHIALVTNGFVASLLVSNQPLGGADLERLGEKAQQYRHQIAIAPGSVPAHPLLASIIAAETRGELVSISDGADLNITPPTDQNPYFFNMLKLSKLGEGQGRGVLNSGVISGNLTATYTLLALIAALLMLSVPMIFGPVWLSHRLRSGPQIELPVMPSLFFALIGAGFMAVEIGLLQFLSVFLGHPVYGLGVLLFGIIASTGAGSYLSDHLNIRKAGVRSALVGLTLLGIAIAYGLLSTFLSSWIVLPILAKAAISVLIIAPLGLMLGCYFPTAMGLLQSRHEPAMPWFWALNGFFGVLSSALATFLAIYVGIWVNFLIGGLCYALTLLCLSHIARATDGG